jgi:hypothetical protein
LAFVLQHFLIQFEFQIRILVGWQVPVFFRIHLWLCVCACSRRVCAGGNFGRDHCRRQSGATSARFCSRLVGVLLLLFEDPFQGCQLLFGRRLGAPMQTLSISIGRFIAVGCGVRQACSRFLVVPMQVGVGGIRSIRTLPLSFDSVICKMSWRLNSWSLDSKLGCCSTPPGRVALRGQEEHQCDPQPWSKITEADQAVAGQEEFLIG